ncbi:tetratricopeptide repeat protein [Chitiniphilus purpureus]|uniref:Tetratricopeptide repeat protein n=1 Tax=Chitiniphilus purpureus TaxID=2981137 RepID=A0ABY6DN54_9NEIS|nr:tetratricopeptide repeat protein [Chitiniphilus sp. CD1]UXY15794.1 tetratricopeptide repeat protein [Chitiniphilus sp. CD1]
MPDPSLADTLRTLLEQGESLSAYRLALAALDRNPADAACHRLAGACAAELGEQAQAERLWRTALALDPDDAATHFNLALLLEHNGQDRQAAAHYAATLARQPDDAEAIRRHGLLLARLHEYGPALPLLRRAAARAPLDAELQLALGDALAAAAPDDAEAHYLNALALAPQAVEPVANLALLLDNLGQTAEAEAHYRQALTLAPARAELHRNLAGLLARQGRTTEAEAAYAAALRHDPDAPATHSNLGVLLADLGREQEAEAAFRHALTLAPGYARARLNLAFLLLAQGRWHEGWLAHEARLDPGLPQPGRLPTDLGCPYWQGEPLGGKTVLLWLEQGYGDQLQFCRYATSLKESGAARVVLVCQPPLLRLLHTLAAADAVLPLDAAADASHGCDYWIMSMSLPRHFGLVDGPWPYLGADAAEQARWAPQLPQGPLRVGLFWRGNPRHHNDTRRSLPGPAVLAPLAVSEQIRFVSLQPGDTEAAAPPQLPLTRLGDALTDFADTAAILTQLDLLISVDSAVAHLAGALGVPCWILLPARGTDWRWLRNSRHSPWYPDNVQLFRQTTPGDWEGLIDHVAVTLAAWARGR